MGILKQILAASAVMLMAVSGAAGATKNIVGGQLIGATGVDVGGTLWDVSFEDGTCAGLFGSCENSSFPFATATLAETAAEALLSQVLTADIRADPTQVNGCSNTTNYSQCSIVIPVSVSGLSLAIRSMNIFNTGYGSNTANFMGVNADTGSSTATTFAVFSQATSVPLPAAIWLLGSGVAALGFGAVRGRAQS
ncbi:MAG: VPLPA-CTERM sorting domain-containing protein [Salaquimonas sp.]|jgi:hypothetical protein|nr:VPLPA-CTERM sorting domain-containing protein [Salaquimonas sp.]